MKRLLSLLVQCPPDLPPRLLDVGCGDGSSVLIVDKALPGWTLYGLDIDGPALRRARTRWPDLRLVQADAAHLPALLHTAFGLVLVRHPDLHRHPAWTRIIPALPGCLAPGGLLLITLYAPDEIDLIRGLPLPVPYPLDERLLAPVGLAGHDRFALAYRPATIVGTR